MKVIVTDLEGSGRKRVWQLIESRDQVVRISVLCSGDPGYPRWGFRVFINFRHANGVLQYIKCINTVSFYMFCNSSFLAIFDFI
jgi:hypothetical protein